MSLVDEAVKKWNEEMEKEKVNTEIANKKLEKIHKIIHILASTLEEYNSKQKEVKYNMRRAPSHSTQGYVFEILCNYYKRSLFLFWDHNYTDILASMSILGNQIVDIHFLRNPSEREIKIMKEIEYKITDILEAG